MSDNIRTKVTDQIADNQERRDRWDNDPEHRKQYEAVGLKKPKPLTKDNCYPQSATYTFGEFAGPVFEYGGYGDMSMIDPYTLRRLWVGGASEDEQISIYDYLRKVIDEAEKIDFLGSKREAETKQ